MANEIFSEVYNIVLDTNKIKEGRKMRRALSAFEAFFSSHGDASRDLTSVDIKETGEKGVFKGRYSAFYSNTEPINLWGFSYHPETGYIVMSKKQPYICLLSLPKVFSSYFGTTMTVDMLNDYIGEYKLGSLGMMGLMESLTEEGLKGIFSYLHELSKTVWENKSIVWGVEEGDGVSEPKSIRFIKDLLLKDGFLGFISECPAMSSWAWVKELDFSTKHFVHSWLNASGMVRAADAGLRLLSVHGRGEEREEAELAVFRASSWDGTYDFAEEWNKVYEEADESKRKALLGKLKYDALLGNISEILSYKGSRKSALQVAVRDNIEEIRKNIEAGGISKYLDSYEEVKKELEEIVKAKEEEIESSEVLVKGVEDVYVEIKDVDEAIERAQKTWTVFAKNFDAIIDIFAGARVGRVERGEEEPRNLEAEMA